VINIKKRLYPAICAALAVFLVNSIFEYFFNDLSLSIKIILNMISAAIGAVFGVAILKEKQD